MVSNPAPLEQLVLDIQTIEILMAIIPSNTVAQAPFINEQSKQQHQRGAEPAKHFIAQVTDFAGLTLPEFCGERSCCWGKVACGVLQQGLELLLSSK